MRTIKDKKIIQQDFEDLLRDESGYESGVPKEIYFPESKDQLREIIKYAAQNQEKITFIGAQSGTTGGAVPVEDCIAICFSSMNRIHKIEWPNNSSPILYCDPGITLNEIAAFLRAPKDWPYYVEGSEYLGDNMYFYPPDPTETTAQLGGTVATNASGARTFRFGPTRSHIQYLSLITAGAQTVSIKRDSIFEQENGFNIHTDQGTLINIPPLTYSSPDTKNASGYYSKPQHPSKPKDLIDLFIGSEGTLACISEIGILLHHKIEFLSGLSFFDTREGAFDFADFLKTDSNCASIEYFDQSTLDLINANRTDSDNSIPEFPGNKTCAILWEYMENDLQPFESIFEIWENKLIENGSSFDETWSGFDLSEQQRLKNFRHIVPETINRLIAAAKRNCKSIRKIGTDSALSDKSFRAVYNESLKIIETANVTFASFGHLGNNHLHINLIPQNEKELSDSLRIYDSLMQLAVNNGGTVSAEHGIGKIKKNQLLRMYGPDAINQMRRVKDSLDPDWIFNPGNMF